MSSVRRLGRDGTWEVFAPHIEKKGDEVAANLMISLIRQCTYLLAKQIAHLEEDFKKHGGIRERMYAARSEARGEDWGKAAYSRLAGAQTLDELTARYREMSAELRRMATGIKARKGWA
ncbi:MAG: four helix bundle suffix domain-containing protein [Kiritimatiellae bacterium]|nr:four helix bundle suffix domain-containing protein [Kiritimatiellia bacterium]